MYEGAQIVCPHCWETVIVGLETLPGDHDYVEDCAVCCHPIRLRLRVSGDGDIELMEIENAHD